MRGDQDLGCRALLYFLSQGRFRVVEADLADFFYDLLLQFNFALLAQQSACLHFLAVVLVPFLFFVELLADNSHQLLLNFKHILLVTPVSLELVYVVLNIPDFLIVVHLLQLDLLQHLVPDVSELEDLVEKIGIAVGDQLACH